MQRVTITVDDELAAELDRFMAARSYANRSAGRSATLPAPACNRLP